MCETIIGEMCEVRNVPLDLSRSETWGIHFGGTFTVFDSICFDIRVLTN